MRRELDHLIRVIYTRPKVAVYYSMNSVNIFDQRKELKSKIISNPETRVIKEGEFVKGVGKYNNPEVFPYICEHPLSLVEEKYKKVKKKKWGSGGVYF